jgi:hypothetical protein
MKMSPGDAPYVAQAFEEHDRSSLPRDIGAVRRTLFSYHGLYFHLVEAPDDLDGDLMDRIYSWRSHPMFAETAERVKPYLTPYIPTWQGPRDSRATEFYCWEAE